MWVCLCNPFSDKTVKKHLSDKGSACTVAKTYSACSGGETPNCCQCLETLKDIVQDHNKTITA